MTSFFLNSIHINSFTKSELLNQLVKILRDKNSNELITTFNLNFLNISIYNNEFKETCKQSKFNLADGHGITLLIWLKYKRRIERITGNDIFPILLKLASDNNLRIAIIGGWPKVSKKLDEIIKMKYSINPENLLLLAPKYKFEYQDDLNKKVIERIKMFKPDILVASLGCPRQEIWLQQNKNEFGSKVNVGIGATIDYFTGFKKRSPLFLQKLGLEWFWRLINEPIRLFKRYVVHNIPFFLKSVIKILFTNKI